MKYSSIRCGHTLEVRSLGGPHLTTAIHLPEPFEPTRQGSKVADVIRDTLPQWEQAQSGILEYYRALENRLVTVVNRPDLGQAFRFRGNEALPLYGWFNFKEGFTRGLVDSALTEFGSTLRGGAYLVDPFAGMATTPLTGALKGIPSIGVEVNPFFHWVGKCKLNAYRIDLQLAGNAIAAIRGMLTVISAVQEKWPLLTTFHDYYRPDILNELIRVRDLVPAVVRSVAHRATAEDIQLVEDFLLVGLAPVVELGCSLEKKGRGLKSRKSPLSLTVPQLRERIFRQWELQLSDVRAVQRSIGRGTWQTPRLENASAVEYGYPDDAVGMALFSPPYCNSFDYSEVYKLELWFHKFVQTYEEWQDLRRRTLRSHAAVRFGRAYHHANSQPAPLATLIDYLSSDGVRSRTWANYGMLVRGYFDDMTELLTRLSSACVRGAHVMMVVGGSSYLALPIATDLLLCEIASGLGFRPKEIRVGRQLVTAGQQWQFATPEVRHFLRESAVILEKV